MADQKISEFTEVLSIADNTYLTVVIEGTPNVNRKVQRQNTGLARAQDLADHEADTANPHATTYTQVGADAAGSAAAVQSALNSHTGDGTIHFTVASLGLGTAAFTNATAYQPYDADLVTWAGVTPGTGVGTALAVNVGTAGSFVANGGALGTPSSGTLTNCSGLPASGVTGTALVASAIGTTVQAYDADLTTWAGVTPGAGVGTALAVSVGTAGSLVTNGGALGTPSSGTLTNCSGLPAAGVTGTALVASAIGTTVQAYDADLTTWAGVTPGTGVATALAVNAGSAGSVGRLIALGTAALGTASINSGASASVVTVAATGVLTTDVVDWGFNQSPMGVTGYNAASTSGCLVITAYPTANNVNFVVSNPTAGAITPGALTLNWKVVR